MKQVFFVCILVVVAVSSFAQQPATPAQTPTTAQPQPQNAPPPAKTLPQAKSKEEFDAYQQAATVVMKGDPAQGEAAVNDFAAKFKDSQIAPLLYHQVLGQYQSQNNADKAIEVGQKILAMTPNDPIANVLVSSLIAQQVRETDLDRDPRLAEAEKDAKRSLETVDTDFMYRPGTPQEQVDAAKNMLRSMAYAALANVEATRSNYPASEGYFKKAAEVPGAQMDTATWLRYTLLLEREKKYPEALTIANKAIDSAPAGSKERELATKERDRLKTLVGNSATPTPAAQPASPK